MTYQPKSVRKMAHFESLSHLYLPEFKNQMSTFYVQRLSCKVLYLPGKKFDSQPSSLF